MESSLESRWKRPLRSAGKCSSTPRNSTGLGLRVEGLGFRSAGRCCSTPGRV